MGTNAMTTTSARIIEQYKTASAEDQSLVQAEFTRLIDSGTSLAESVRQARSMNHR
jgi:hypothetical protein